MGEAWEGLEMLKIFVGKPKCKRSLGRLKRKWYEETQMDKRASAENF
jgi:hypothetical protein